MCSGTGMVRPYMYRNNLPVHSRNFRSICIGTDVRWACQTSFFTCNYSRRTVPFAGRRGSATNDRLMVTDVDGAGPGALICDLQSLKIPLSDIENWANCRGFSTSEKVVCQDLRI